MRRQRDILALLSFIVISSFHVIGCVAAEIQLVNSGQTSYRIYHAPNAVPSVLESARELYRYIKRATGAQMPIINSAQPPEGAIISVGRNAASNAAGLRVDDLKPEGFIIATRGDNIYILGPDTPHKQTTLHGGTSHGTRNGVYAFLEQTLDIRWLMPGTIGEDIPTRTNWQVTDLNIKSEPAFPNRRLPYIQNRNADVKQWSNRMKLGYSLRLNHGHYWRATVPAKLFDEHPDWFAMKAGKRVPPIGRYKLETTNPQLIDFYATKAATILRNNPQRYTYSVSPSDSAGWSTSPESLRLYETDPNGKESITPLVLDFYINVAKQLKRKLPNGAVAGYIYANYIYPPNEGIPPLPDNLYLVIAPSFDYGYTLFRKDIQAQFNDVIGKWTKASDNIAFYDLPNKISQNLGAPGAPGLEILAFLFPKLAQVNMKSMYLYGQEAWGTGAMSNYIMARMMWDPHLNPHELADEYCVRAYGASAGPKMRRLYKFLDDITKAHYNRDKQARYVMTNAMLKGIYADHYEQIESQFLTARDAATDPIHRKRMAMYEQNLALLQWNLRMRGMAQVNEQSPLYRNDKQISTMLSEKRNTLSLSAGAMIQSAIVDIEPMTASVLPAVTSEEPSQFYLRGASRVALYPQADEEITITPAAVVGRGNLVRFNIYDSTGKQITRGILSNGQPIRFFGSENQLYFMKIDARSASYSFSIEGAAWAVEIPEAEHQQRLHFLTYTTPVYFQVQPGTKQFVATLSSASPGETAAGVILSPTGKIHGTFDTSDAPADRQTITVDKSGTWTFRGALPKSGIVDDVYISFDKSISRWVSLDGRRPLIIKQVQ